MRYKDGLHMIWKLSAINQGESEKGNGDERALRSTPSASGRGPASADLVTAASRLHFHRQTLRQTKGVTRVNGRHEEPMSAIRRPATAHPPAPEYSSTYISHGSLANSLAPSSLRRPRSLLHSSVGVAPELATDGGSGTATSNWRKHRISACASASFASSSELGSTGGGTVASEGAATGAGIWTGEDGAGGGWCTLTFTTPTAEIGSLSRVSPRCAALPVWR